MNEAHRNLLKAVVGSPKGRSAKGVSSNLYMLRHPWEPWIKIGVAGGVSGRMATYVHAWGCEPPVPPVIADSELIELLGFVSARDMEFKVLNIFAPQSIRGEWLYLAPEVRLFETALAQRDMKTLERLLSIGHRQIAIA